MALPSLNEKSFKKAKELLDLFVAIPFNEELAEIAALVRRQYSFKLPDAAIAATALKLKQPLVTRDKQFSRIKELTVINL